MKVLIFFVVCAFATIGHGAPRANDENSSVPITEAQLDCIVEAVKNNANLSDVIRACRPSVVEDSIGCLKKISEIQACFK
jgi:hypothetical protein